MNVGTELEEGEGTRDSPEQYLKHMDGVAALYGEKVECPEVARAYAENNGSMVDWLDKGLNVDFGQRTGAFGIYDAVASLLEGWVTYDQSEQILEIPAA